MSSAVITPAPTNFAEFEAAGGKMPPQQSAEPVAQTEEPSGAEETSAESETDPEPVQKTTQEKPAEPQKGAEKRTLTSERDKLLAEVTELRKQRRELQEQHRTAPDAQPAKPAEQVKVEDKPPVRPKLNDFETVEEYEAAVAKYDDDRDAWRERRAEARAAEEKAKQRESEIRESYKEKLIKHLEQHPDYDDQIDQTPMSELMASAVMHHGPELGQVLIDNRAESARISKLPRDIQIFEMGRLFGEAKAAAVEPATSETQVTSEPVKVPAKLGATGGGSPDGKKPRNFAEFEAAQQRLNTKRK